MKNSNLKYSLFTAVSILIVVFLAACKSTDHKTGFEMQAEIWGERDSSEIPIYLTGTKPIDSVDVNKLIFDIYRIEIDEYPDNLKVYSRVYDSLGNFVTNMADPYKKDSAWDYFNSVTEQLGETYEVRRVAIDSFNVREYGAGDSIPYNIVLTMDYSGSMSAVLDAIFEGTEIFVSLKMKYDKIALTSFTKELDVKVPLMGDKDTIISWYKMKYKEGLGIFSGMFNAVLKSMDLFEGTSMDVPRVLVVFSDGDDNYSKQEVESLVRKARDEKIHIFSVAFGYSIDENLRYLAKHTGGKFYKAYTKEELIAIFRDIYMSLRYYYYITYKPPKYWGLHKVWPTIVVPGREDSLIAEGEYDASDLWGGLGDEFERPILFDFDSAVVKPASYPIINELVDAMLSQPRLKLEIQGHTDNVGTMEYNQILSEQRAQAVFNEIVKRGVDPRRLRWRGFGKTKPVANNTTEEGRQRNRRTVFVILAK
jgi:hypothetical protein